MEQNNSYSIEQLDTHVLITIQKFDFSGCKAFETEALDLFPLKQNLVAIDCGGVNVIPNDWVRIILRLQLEMKKVSKDKILRIVSANPNLNAALKMEGLDSSLKVIKDINMGLMEIGITPKKNTLNTEFINPFLDATLHVLSVQASIQAKPGQVTMKKEADKTFGDVSGIISIVSKSFNGSFVISFPEKTFLKVMSGMLGEDYTEINKDLIDGAGEITNMIYGSAKIVLNEKGHGINMAIPSVISGKDHSLSAMTKGPRVVVPFSSNAGEFFVEICLNK